MSRASSKSTALSEFQLIAALTRELERAGSAPARVELGIGDDAAVLRVGRAEKWVWTVDACIEGVHFEAEWLSFEDIGFRATMAAASDVAAMGAEPIAALSSLEVGGQTPSELLSVARGQAKAAGQLGMRFVGGNVTRANQLGIHTSVLGAARRTLTRDGARPGDEVWLLGRLGLAAAGLALLRRNPRVQASGVATCVRAWRRPRALVKDAQRLVGRARSCLDVSDGLAADCGHLAQASGVQVLLSARALRKLVTPALRNAGGLLHVDPLEWVLHGGEDYALIATGPAQRRPDSARVVGEVRRGDGVLLASEDGTSRPLRGGHDHLAPLSGA